MYIYIRMLILLLIDKAGWIVLICREWVNGSTNSHWNVAFQYHPFFLGVQFWPIPIYWYLLIHWCLFEVDCYSVESLFSPCDSSHVNFCSCTTVIVLCVFVIPYFWGRRWNACWVISVIFVIWMQLAICRFHSLIESLVPSHFPIHYYVLNFHW